MWKWSPTSVDDSLREWQASNWGAFAESVLSFTLSGEPLADDDYELASPPAASIHASDSPAMKQQLARDIEEALMGSPNRPPSGEQFHFLAPKARKCHQYYRAATTAASPALYQCVYLKPGLGHPLRTSTMDLCRRARLTCQSPCNRTQGSQPLLGKLTYGCIY